MIKHYMFTGNSKQYHIDTILCRYNPNVSYLGISIFKPIIWATIFLNGLDVSTNLLKIQI